MAEALGTRKRNAPALPTDNSDAFDRDEVLRQRINELKQRKADREITKAADKKKQELVTETYRFMKAELGMTRPEVDELLRDMEADKAEVQKREQQRAKDRAAVELYVAQGDLFEDVERPGAVPEAV